METGSERGREDGGASNRAGKLPAVSGGCVATYRACATPEQLVLLGAHCLDVHPAPTSSHLPASGLRAHVLRLETKSYMLLSNTGSELVGGAG